MRRIDKFRLFIIAGILLSLMAASVAPAQELEDVIFLEGAYYNPVYKFKGVSADGTPTLCASADIVDPCTTDACKPCMNGATFFSGNVQQWGVSADGPTQNIPNDGANHYLARSSIGWASPATVGWVNPSGDGSPGNPRDAAEGLAQKGSEYIKEVENIFYSYYDNTGDVQNPDDIYLAYDFDLSTGYVIDPATGEPRSAVLFDDAAANGAKQNFFRAWKINPNIFINKEGKIVDPNVDPEAIHIKSRLLDIAYYQSAALVLKGNLCLEKAFNVRFMKFRSEGNEIDDELKFLGWSAIHKELRASSDGAWGYFNDASQIWLDVFASPIQRKYLVDLAESRKLGQQDNSHFTKEPPSDWAEPENWPPMVYDGYKDAVIMMRALAQRAKVVHEVARRLVLTEQRPKAAELVANNVRQLAMEEGVIMSILFADNNGNLPDNHEEHYPGLAESFLEYRKAVTSMIQTGKAANNERLNALGFDRDIVKIVPGSNNEKSFTYEHLSGKLFSANDNQALNELKISWDQDELAKKAKTQYSLKASNFLSEIDRIGDQYDRELIAITGYDGQGDPNLTNPAEGGGLLEQQIGNVELASNAIQRVIRQMENVHLRIENEKKRVEQVNSELGVRADMSIKYGGKEATLTKEISDIQAEMAFANNLANAAASALSPSSWVTFGVPAAVHTANAFVQRNLQRKIGAKQAEMVKLRAEKEAAFIYSDQRINDINSEARIKEWYLELRIYEIDLLDAELRYGQELDKLAQYYTDIENLVMRRERAETRVVQRHFADPTFRIEVNEKALIAEQKFQKAQAAVYLCAKSLEYKWPLHPDRTFLKDEIAQIVRARTADTLLKLMSGLDTKNGEQVGDGWDLFYWNFSLRKDYLKMTESVAQPDGSTLTEYQQFQNWLKFLKADPANLVDRDKNGTMDHLSIPFSTVKFDINDGQELESQSLYTSTGEKKTMPGRPIFDARLWDDKIDLVHVNVIGGNNVYPSGVGGMPVELWYGGSGFVRTKEDKIDTDGAVLDFIAYPAGLSWKIDNNDDGFGWVLEEYTAQAMTAKTVTNPRDVPADVFHTKNFRELPVAATGWRLLIPLDGTNFDAIRDIEIIIIHKARTRPAI